MESIDQNQEERMHELRSSRGLDREQTHITEGAISEIHNNSTHGQDAFAIANTEKKVCIAVTDGVTGHEEKDPQPNSDDVALIAAEKLAEIGVNKPLSEVEAKDLEPLIKELEKLSDARGASTFSAVSVERDTGDVEILVYGDSPVFVVETDYEGRVVAWQLADRDCPVNIQTYTNADSIRHLSHDRVHCVSVENGKTSFSKDSMMIRYKIPYQKGLKIVIGSDFLTKVLLHTPQIAGAQIQHLVSMGPKGDQEKIRQERIEYWSKVLEWSETQFKELWGENEEFDPLILERIPKDKLHDFLEKWKTMHRRSNDDVTQFILDVDKIKNTDA